jgi:hypothetical protein
MMDLFSWQRLFIYSGRFDADSMLAAGGGYTLGQHFEPRRNLSMTILQAFGAREIFGPFWRAHAQLHTQIHAQVLAQVLAQVVAQALTFVLGRLTTLNSGDVGWAILAMALRLLGAALALAERQLSIWARSVLRRAWQGARFAAGRRAADSMVAAGGR